MVGVGETSLFQAEGKASAKALRQERAYNVERTVRKVRGAVVSNRGGGLI